MDEIQAYKEDFLLYRARVAPWPPRCPAHNPAVGRPLRTTSRRSAGAFWMVLAVAVPLAIVSSIVVLKLPPVYLAKAEIEINPPRSIRSSRRS